MIEERTRMRAADAPWADQIEILIRQGKAIAVDITMRELEPGEWVKRPTLAIDRTAAQELMDDLWRCGIRPTEGAGSAGAMAAVQSHLEDMRTIVFRHPGFGFGDRPPPNFAARSAQS